MDISELESWKPELDPDAGQFEGKFLLAMPNLESDVFEGSIIYICAHSDDGAMGFQVNKMSNITLDELVARSDLSKENSNAVEAQAMTNALVRNGGPVDEHRGFVLHSEDYHSDATIPISNTVHLTSNLQILRSIVHGQGPQKMAVSLGYTGWGPGQLEQEMADNVWLCVDADVEIVFDENDDGKYEHLLALLGIQPENFICEAGNA